MKIPSRTLCQVPATLLAVGSFLAGGCAHLVRHPSAGEQFVVVETENIWVTGSQIPVRVPKSATARMLPTISPVDIITPDDMRRMPTAPMH